MATLDHTQTKNQKTIGTGKEQSQRSNSASAPRTTHISSSGNVLKAVDLQKDSLGYVIKQAQVRSYEMLFRVLGPDTLSPGRMIALNIVARQPGINQSELAEKLSITRAGVVKVVDTLENLSYVERQKIPDNRRSYALVATAAGLNELQRLESLTRQFEKEIAVHLTKEERRLLISLLNKVAI